MKEIMTAETYVETMKEETLSYNWMPITVRTLGRKRWMSHTLKEFRNDLASSKLCRKSPRIGSKTGAESSKFCTKDCSKIIINKTLKINESKLLRKIV
ncbi:hypothetical protein NPIL_242301 [Nephila pilipes]|uniref:Uncharacterized protein n=1 Tax=Nephila pilipes TaxID=299642 RepID=A0A8X6QNJ0_NEPPI|nr:hypothetical protein NPIL_242301 [Nephila pilipes]